MAKYLSNAFSLQMLDSLDHLHLVSITPVEPEEIPGGLISAIGHADTAAVVGDILGMEVPCNRVSIKIHDGDTLYVAQLTGGRLPEGATTLPDGFSIQFVKVTIV